MAKGCLFLMLGIIALITVPVCIGIAGGLFGLMAGLIGAIFGLVFGILGGIFRFIGWIFKGIFHLLFGWHSDYGFHHWHFNIFAFAILIVLIIAFASRRKN